MKNNKSLVYKRQQTILKHLKENGSIKVTDLAEFLSVSPLTIRRDLDSFQEKGIVTRFYGGATLVDGALRDDPSFSESSHQYDLQKHAIAKKAASLIEDGDTILINSSSTALLVLQYLEGKHVIIITNNGKALQVPKQPGIELVLTGGEVYERKQSMVGEYATHILAKISANKCLLGVSGISVASGITTSVLQETAINKMMLERCNGKTIIVADSSKIGRGHNFSSGTVNQVSCLITDSSANPKELDLLRENGIDVMVVDLPIDNDKPTN